MSTDIEADARRVVEQMMNLMTINPEEAASICMAHARFLAVMAAIGAGTEEMFREEIYKLSTILLHEGLQYRKRCDESKI